MAAPVPPGWGKCRRCPGMFHEALLSKADLCPQCASNEVVSNSLAPSNMPGPAESSGTRSTARATAVNDFRGAMIDLLRSQSSTVGGSQTTPTAARNEAVSKFGPYTPKTNFISGASRVVKRSSKSSDATSSMAKKAKNGSVPVPKILPTYTFTATYLFGFRASDGPNEKDRIDVYPQPDEAV
ncbi:hypothetical protein HDU79_011168 [Rhizoclosmatium sp. JEL0117]|nr:hypothetical protein HDU79_011168 [Rhizoclosmatium sp. JEL0117]